MEIYRGEIYNWEKTIQLISNSLKSNQLSPTEFPIRPSWSKILFQLEIQYSNTNHLTATQYQLNPIRSNWIANWNELAILVRDTFIYTLVFKKFIILISESLMSESLITTVDDMLWEKHRRTDILHHLNVLGIVK